MKKTLILVLIVAMAAGLTMGCCKRMAESFIEEAIEAEGGEDVDIDIGGLTGSKPPKDLPKDLIFPKAKSTGFLSASTDEGSGGFGSLETSASISKVRKYYEGLDGKGWTLESTMEASTDEGESVMFTISRKDGFGAFVTLTEDKGKTIIGLAYGEDFDQ